ncbi:MAG: hypothetical protein IJ262_05080 [Clostridia bacterium]|nr:hypothetical protein [Clostridia bacterium]
MKKTLSVILACLMLLSSFGVLSSAEESLIDKITGSVDFDDALSNFDQNGTIIPDEYLENGTADVEALLESGAINELNFLGITVDFLYNSTDALAWNKVTVDKADLTLAKANLNLFLSDVFESVYGEEGSTKLYTAENATAFVNFIGKLLNPNFTEVKLTGNGYSSENDFYTAIAQLSGLKTIIDNYWCKNYAINYSPLLYVIGFDFDDELMLGDKIRNADRVSRVIVKSIIKRIRQQGPLNYVLNVVSNLAKSYETHMFPALKALFTLQINSGVIGEDELKTLKGLFNLFANFHNEADTEHLQFITPPSYRFAKATKFDGSQETTDTTEVFLYALMYLNLCGAYSSQRTTTAPVVDSNGNYITVDTTGREVSLNENGEYVYSDGTVVATIDESGHYVDSNGNYFYAYVKTETKTVTINNAAVVSKIESSIRNSGKIDSKYKDNLIRVLNCAFKGKMKDIVSVMDDIASDNIDNATSNPMNFLYEFFAYYIQWISDIFDKIVDSLTNFGDF